MTVILDFAEMAEAFVFTLAFDVMPAFERIALDPQRSIAHYRSSQLPWLQRRFAVSLVRVRYAMCHHVPAGNVVGWRKT